MMRKNRWFAFILVLVLSIPYMPLISASGDTIHIYTAKDFADFSQKCTLDSWSRGKTVSLENDIDLKKLNVSSVPIFYGKFYGNGHTISGFKLSSDGSHYGLFRYIGTGATVSDLNVKLKNIGSGSKCSLGGIAGENDGTVENCTVDGMVKGKSIIGGIVGENKTSGRLISCTINGSVLGENKVGGIVGKNNGLVLNCTNNAEVNTSYEDKKQDLSNLDFDVDSFVETYVDKKDDEETDPLVNSDIGGIVGYSLGIVEGSVNNSKIGYPHIGYNVGGICGRQKGYVLGCINNGIVRGRKDVGGIVGQAEPYITLDSSSKSLGDIRTELVNLQSLTNALIADTDNLNDDVYKILENISGDSKLAQDSTRELLDSTNDFVDTNLGKANAEVAVISNAIRKAGPVFENFESASEEMIDAIDELDSLLDEIDELDDTKTDAKSSKGSLKSAANSMHKALKKVSRAVKSLQDSVLVRNEKKTRAAVSDLSISLRDLITAKKDLKEDVETIYSIISTKTDDFEVADTNTDTIKNAAQACIDSLAVMIEQLENIDNDLFVILENSKIDFESLSNVFDNIYSAIKYFDDALYYLAIDKDISKISDSLSNALSYFKEASGELAEIAEDISQTEPLEFELLKDNINDISDKLFDSFSSISTEIETLRQTTHQKSKKLTADIGQISEKFNTIMNMMVSKIEDVTNEGREIEDVIVDASNEDLERTKEGKIDDCTNFGNIEADRNVGGIVGTMGIEFTKDPEDELKKPDSLNFKYITKDIVISCVNDGETVGKKDCVGGVVGCSEIGTVYKCEGYGRTESTDGNYVGGVAGKSNSMISESYGKCSAVGKRFVGGVAGRAKTVSSCLSIAEVSGDESVGAILGEADKEGKISLNAFIDNGIGAVDGISYDNNAEPITYDELKSRTNIPKRFVSFTVTFVADGRIVEKRDIEYDSDTYLISYPKVPNKRGYYGRWKKPEEGKVKSDIKIECEYKPYITVISSEEKDDSGKIALALAEGKFDDRARLHITKNSDAQPPEKLDKYDIYDISIQNTEDKESVTVRILNKDKNKVRAWELVDDKWEEVKTKPRGKYVILSMSSHYSTVCLEYQKRSYVSIILVSALLLLIICALAFVIGKKFNKRRGESMPDKDAETEMPDFA